MSKNSEQRIGNIIGIAENIKNSEQKNPGRAPKSIKTRSAKKHKS
jgi:hypothetical protein